jgi:hypothetical protein
MYSSWEMNGTRGTAAGAAQRDACFAKLVPVDEPATIDVDSVKRLPGGDPCAADDSVRNVVSARDDS